MSEQERVPDMSTAMFRTLTETMGMDPAWIASELDVSERTVRGWATMKPDGYVPVFARLWIREWWATFQDRVADAIEGALDMEVAQEQEFSYATIARYKSDRSLRRAGVDMPLSMHSALVGLVAFGLEQADISARVVWREEEM